METLSNVLYWLSTGLFVPVMLGTVIMFIYALVLSGSFYNAYKEYLVYRKNIYDFICKPDTDRLAQLAEDSKNEASPYISDILKHSTSVAAMERILADFELAADKSLGRYKMLAKLGPILGLMGTLIPMGPALAGLGSGDVSSMSWNMQVAFSTTVIGLFAGTIGFLILQPKQRMYMHYLSDLEYLVGHLSEQMHRKSGHHHHTSEMVLTDNVEKL
jgi:biopolymer transport protein ExbB/TolQ